MKNNPAHTLIEAIGHSVLRECLGLTERNLRHAKSVGYFAAKWYAPMKALAESNGVHCPLDAFNFERPANKFGTNGNNPQVMFSRLAGPETTQGEGK